MFMNLLLLNYYFIQPKCILIIHVYKNDIIKLKVSESLIPINTKVYIIDGKIHHANNRGISFSDSSSGARCIKRGAIKPNEANPESSMNNEKYLKLSVAIHTG